jgi:hypothetical protein
MSEATRKTLLEWQGKTAEQMYADYVAHFDDTCHDKGAPAILAEYIAAHNSLATYQILPGSAHEQALKAMADYTAHRVVEAFAAMFGVDSLLLRCQVSPWLDPEMHGGTIPGPITHAELQASLERHREIMQKMTNAVITDEKATIQ